MNKLIAFLKAIGIVFGILFLVIFGVTTMIGIGLYIGSNKPLQDILSTGIVVIMLIILFLLILYCIGIAIKENYEKYLELQDNPLSDYKIVVNEVKTYTDIIRAKTPRQAMKLFWKDDYYKLVVDSKPDDVNYKIIKVKKR